MIFGDPFRFRGAWLFDGPKPQRIHHRQRARAHGEDVAQNAAHAGGRALERLDVAGVVVALDLESAGPAVAHVDDAGVLARPLHDAIALGGQALEVDAARLVGAVLAPHHAVNAEFGERGLALAEKLFDFFVLVGSEAVLTKNFRRYADGRHCESGRGHGEALLSHLAGHLGRTFIAQRRRPGGCPAGAPARRACTIAGVTNVGRHVSSLAEPRGGR